MKHVDHLSYEAVRGVLKKGKLRPWQKRHWCISKKAVVVQGNLNTHFFDIPYTPKTGMLQSCIRAAFHTPRYTE